MAHGANQVRTVPTTWYAMRQLSRVGCLLLFASGARTREATKYTLSDGQGRCLDGTPGAYYVQLTASSSRQWYIYHEGGGFCSDLGDCALRSNSYLGSSRSEFWPPHLDLDAQEPHMGCVPHVFACSPRLESERHNVSL